MCFQFLGLLFQVILFLLHYVLTSAASEGPEWILIQVDLKKKLKLKILTEPASKIIK